MKRLLVIGGAILMAAGGGQAYALPTTAQFQGTWRLSRLIGGAGGGVTAQDPKAVLGQTVVWTASGVQSPEGRCTFKDPDVVSTPNRDLETGLWGGQRIAHLNLSKMQIRTGFGVQKTPVFTDGNDCADAVLIGHDHLIFELSSGWIYLLDRVGH